MGTRSRAVLAFIGALITSSCAAFAVDQEARCAEANARLRECLGDDAEPFECEGVPSDDLRAIERVLRDDRCELLRELLPFDGDYRSTACRATGSGCRDPLATLPAPVSGGTRFPILLVNGIDTSPLFRYSDRILDTLRDAGHTVELATLPPYETTVRRSEVLLHRIEQVAQATGATQVHLICHSLGGLDCRYLVSPNGLALDLGADPMSFASRVSSVTTVSTAHRGTRIADVALRALPSGELGDDVDDAAAFFGDWLGDGASMDQAQLRAAIGGLSESATAAFNEETPDAPAVLYQSWAGFSRPFGVATAEYDASLRTLCRPTEEADSGGLSFFDGEHDFMATALIPTLDIVERRVDEGTGELLPDPSDGLCPVRSARWGRFRGCIPADHMEQLGQRDLPDVNVRTGFDIAWFYAFIAADLAARGL